MTEPQDPVPPTNARLEFDNGDIIPLECTYEGFIDGMHVWKAVTNIDVTGRQAARLLFDTIPGYTSIVLEMTDKRDEG